VSAVTDENKAIARAISDAFGSRPSVVRYWDDAHAHHVDIASVVDHPYPAISAYATIGVSDSLLAQKDADESLRVEMLGACRTKHEGFANILATAGFCVINSHWGCFPGAIFSDVVSTYYPSHDMTHLMFVSPFLWEDRLATLYLPTKTVAWLLAVPISGAERSYAESEGSDALEALFEERSIDIFDLDRASVL